MQRNVKALSAFVFLFSAAWLGASATDDPPVKMAEIVVIGKKIPSGWFTISWRCKGPLPLDRVSRAWVSNVLEEGPAAKAGVKRDDTLLAIGNVPVVEMTGVSLRWNLEREREAGTQEEFLLKTADGRTWVFVVKFERGSGASR